MKFWRIEADWKELDWDRYEGFVVCAESAEDALSVIRDHLNRDSAWAKRGMKFFDPALATLKVEELIADWPRGVVLTDYSAG